MRYVVSVLLDIADDDGGCDLRFNPASGISTDVASDRHNYSAE
jgi:hypothetical protein